MTKKDVYKLKPGTWLKVTYSDSKPDVALLVEKVVRGRGDVSIKLFFPKEGFVNCHSVHTQIAAYLGMIQIPILAKVEP